ncbi:ABC transporter substrate-binding protein [Jannaschia marina]|uniref:ABC transporter substrate-binding protein n=1 Tax=Jannaschia marina TaxID=2741674 RepID=UPI0015CC3C9A|nr:ABC transporter substrate-binding protein [Jannaschia marina]
MTRFLTCTALALAFGTPAFAQSPICGGISVVGEWVGGDEAGSDLTGAAAPFDGGGQVPIAGHLVRMFTLSADTDVRIDVAAVPAGDPYISVYDAAGAEVAADDDSGGDFAARVQTTLGPGTYCLAARSYESGVTDVSVQIGAASTFDGDGGTSAPQAPAAPEVAPPVVAAGRGAGCFEDGMASLGEGLSPATLGASATVTAGDAPALGFTLLESAPLSVLAESETGDPLIRLRDESGATLAENDDFDGLNSRIDMTAALAPGAYCIELEDLNGTDNSIDVRLESFDPAADRLRRLNAAEFAPTASDEVPVTDLGTLETALLQQVQASGDTTWFTFDLPAGGLLLTEAIGDGLDPMVVLFDRVGRRVGENDDGPEGLDSFLASRLLPGRYTLGLRLIDDSRGPVRLLMERYVPAQ